MDIRQEQAFDAQVFGDDLFESHFALLRVILRDYREAFRRSSTVNRDHGFFLCGQVLNFLLRLFRRMIPRDNITDEPD